MGLLLVSPAVIAGYELPRNLEEGWDGAVQFGAFATFGSTDTSAVSARTDLSYRGQNVEHEFTAKLFRSSSESLVTRRNVDGKEIFDSDGIPVRDYVKTRTNDRRFFGAHPRWFFTSRHYLFAVLDLEVNKPVDIESSFRQIGGVGYKLWKSRTDFISGVVGVGRKKLTQVSGASEEGAIGYLGVRLKRRLTKVLSLYLDLESDFGGDNRFSQAETSLSWKMRGPVAIKFKYEARFNSKIVNPWNSFDPGVEAAFSVNLEVDVL